MRRTAHGLRRTYKAGCHCDLCKQAESAYKRILRQRQREAVGEFVTRSVPSLSLVTGDGAQYVTSGKCSENLRCSRIGGGEEINGLGAHSRPGLAAAAVALARVLDNPKAVSTQPAAATKLTHLLDTLRKSTVTKPKLASVRRMTKPV